MENTTNFFTLEGLNELLQAADQMAKDSKVKEQNDKMDNFTRIIKGVSRKYASKWIDREDLEQDLWVKVLSMIADCGIDNVTEKMVAKCCFNLAVDKYRYNRRRYETNGQYIEASNVDDNDNGPDYFETRFNSIESALDLMLYKEVINLFSIGSRERKYVVLKMVNYGLIDEKYLDEVDRKDVGVPDEDTEAGYIRLLGYSSKCPGSWTCKKREIDRIIHEFLR